MGRSKIYTEHRTHVSFRWEKSLLALFDPLARNKGLSRIQAVVNCMMDAVKRGAIPEYSLDVAQQMRQLEAQWNQDAKETVLNYATEAQGEIVGPVRRPRKTHLPSKAESASK